MGNAERAGPGAGEVVPQLDYEKKLVLRDRAGVSRVRVEQGHKTIEFFQSAGAADVASRHCGAASARRHMMTERPARGGRAER